MWVEGNEGEKKRKRGKCSKEKLIKQSTKFEALDKSAPWKDYVGEVENVYKYLKTRTFEHILSVVVFTFNFF